MREIQVRQTPKGWEYDVWVDSEKVAEAGDYDTAADAFGDAQLELDIFTRDLEDDDR